MKRFFCTVCNKVKRVQQYPIDIRMSDSDVVNQRIGTCARHSNPSIYIRKSDGQTPFIKATLNIPAKSQQNKRRA